MGVKNNNGTLRQLADRLSRGELDWVFHMGDIAYAGLVVISLFSVSPDNRVPCEFESTWDDFFKQIEPIASRVPYMVCPGNHEYPYKYLGQSCC